MLEVNIVLFDELSTKTKDALNISKNDCPLFSNVLDHILEKSECEDDFRQKVRVELSKIIDNLRDVVINICDY